MTDNLVDDLDWLISDELLDLKYCKIYDDDNCPYSKSKKRLLKKTVDWINKKKEQWQREARLEVIEKWEKNDNSDKQTSTEKPSDRIREIFLKRHKEMVAPPNFSENDCAVSAELYAILEFLDERLAAD